MKGYRLGLYEKSMPESLSLPEKLRHAKHAGYDFMELSIDESDAKLARLAWGDEEIRELRHAMEKEAMYIHTICLSGHRRFPLGDPDRGVREKSLDIMRRAITLAARLGVRIIQLAGYDVYYKQGSAETKALFEQSLKQSVDWAAQHGVILAFETMETEFLNTVEKAAHWVNALQSPWLQIYPDIGNLTNAWQTDGHRMLADLEKGRGHISAIHLKETAPGIYREVPYGVGHVDFVSAVDKVWSLGVRLFVGEFWHTGTDGWEDVLKDNCVWLRTLLQPHY